MTIGSLLKYILDRVCGDIIDILGSGTSSSEFNCHEFQGDRTYLAASPHSLMVRKVPLDGWTTAINRIVFDGSNGVVEIIHLRRDTYLMHLEFISVQFLGKTQRDSSFCDLNFRGGKGRVLRN